MIRFTAALLLFALAASLSAAADTYGKPLTLKNTTKIADIFANPEKYKDQRVKVQGAIADVCTEEGCWIAITEKSSDAKDAATLRFKVEDGVIVFPTSVKGKTVVAEGTIAVTKAADGKVSILLKGEGAEIQ
jgi:hypothetical protein